MVHGVTSSYLYFIELCTLLLLELLLLLIFILLLLLLLLYCYIIDDILPKIAFDTLRLRRFLFSQRRLSHIILADMRLYITHILAYYIEAELL